MMSDLGHGPGPLQRSPTLLLELISDMAPAARPAILDAWCEADLFDARCSPSVCLLRFDVDRFDNGLFAATGIEQPPQIARSVHRRQAEFFFGRLVARAALQLQGLQVAGITIGDQRQPVWPEGVIGSISHIEGLAAAVVSSADVYGGLGVDIESVHTVGKEPQALLATVVDEQEYAYLLSRHANEGFDVLLTTAFSAKESLFKGAHAAVGRYFDFSSARVKYVDRQRRVVSIILQETLCESFVAGQLLHIGYRHLPGDIVLTGFCW
ncbi:4'-phosphopantetheinyl transferase family protein [Tardiphaga sp. P5_C10]